MGHCMNPSCAIDLFPSGVSVAERAHIQPYRMDQDDSFENLIMLCRNCHVTADAQPPSEILPKLRQWKAARQEFIRAHFTARYAFFSQLTDVVTPLLRRNREIFDNYGPSTSPMSDADEPHLWHTFEPELVANNEKLVSILTANNHLLHIENQGIVDRFCTHVAEFVATRGEASVVRRVLFPSELSSIFGLQVVEDSTPAPNVAALQNLISQLIQKGTFVELDLVGGPVLVYRDRSTLAELRLTDRPRMHQIYFTRRLYTPQTTSLRLDGLIFVLRWLHERGVPFEFPDMRKLWRIRLADRYDVGLCYEYCLSVASLNGMLQEDLDIVVNLHNWNGGPVSKEASEQADACDVTLYNQQSFFAFVYRELR